MSTLFTVLVVDDEPHVTDAIVALLQQQTAFALDIYFAYRGKEALEFLERGKFDLLITDIQMPDITGLELLEAVNAKWPACRTLILTGHAVFHYAYEAIQHHAVGYVLKTEKDEVLLEAILNALSGIEQALNQRRLLEEAASMPIGRGIDLNPLFEGGRRREETDGMLRTLGFAAPYAPLYIIQGRAAALHAALLPSLDRIMSHYMGERLQHSVRAQGTEDAPLWLVQFSTPQQALWLNGLLETVQASLRMTLGLELSFVISFPIYRSDRLPQALDTLSEHVKAAPPSDIPSVYTLTEAKAPHAVAASIVQFLREYITLHASEEVSLMQLSSVSGYNADYLARIYKQTMKETIGQAIATERLKHVQTYMRDDTLSIEAIAARAGFASRSYFNRFIKKETGMTPKAYRAHVQNTPAH